MYWFTWVWDSRDQLFVTYMPCLCFWALKQYEHVSKIQTRGLVNSSWQIRTEKLGLKNWLYYFFCSGKDKIFSFDGTSTRRRKHRNNESMELAPKFYVYKTYIKCIWKDFMKYLNKSFIKMHMKLKHIQKWILENIYRDQPNLLSRWDLNLLLIFIHILISSLL